MPIIQFAMIGVLGSEVWGAATSSLGIKHPLQNSSSPVLDPPDLPGFVTLTLGCILIEFKGKLAMLEILKLQFSTFPPMLSRRP